MKLRKKILTFSLLLIVSCTAKFDKLWDSVKKNDIEMVEKILKNNKNTFDCDTQVSDLFTYAIHNKNEKIVKLLIDSNLFDCVKDNEEIISGILTSSFNYAVKIRLIKNGVNINSIILDKGEQVPVYYWMAQNVLPKDLVLFADKITDYSITINGTTFVDLLVLRHHEYIDRYKIDQKLLDIKDSKGDTPLAIAIKKGFVNVALYFIKKGGHLFDISNDNTWFLLTRNWRAGYIDISKAFIKNGLLLTENDNGIEAFKGVLFSRQLDFDGKIEIINWLIANGFNVDQADAEGNSAKDYLFKTSPSIDEPNEFESMKKKKFQKSVLRLLEKNI